jgi:hypothetical protein
MTAEHIPQPVIDLLADHTTTQVMERRSTWTRRNVLAESARTTRGLRMASPGRWPARVHRRWIRYRRSEVRYRDRRDPDWPIGDRAARRSENISDCDRAGECCPRQHVCSRSTTEARIVQCPSKKYAVDSVGTRRFWSAGAAGSPVAA